MKINALPFLFSSLLYQKVTNEIRTFYMKKSYHAMRTTFDEVITQSSGREGSTYRVEVSNIVEIHVFKRTEI